MKYVRYLDDFKRYTFEFFDTFLPQDLSDKMVNYFILNLGNKEQLCYETINFIDKNGLDENVVAEFGEVILQLNDYKEFLKKFIELLLSSKSYEQLSAFLNRIFLQHIGDEVYHSNKKEYSIYQRYFDRFIEIINYCGIDKKLYTPFFLEILGSEQNSNMFEYKEPLKEYLDVFINEDNEDEFVSELLSFGNKFNKNQNLIESSLKTIKNIILEYASEDFNSFKLVKQVLLKNKEESQNIIEEYLINQDDNLRVLQMLCVYKNEKKFYNKLKQIYETSSDQKIKSYLEKECGFSSLVGFNSKEEFLTFVDDKVSLIQERLFGARLKKYYEKYQLENRGINGKILTFVMEFFKGVEVDSQLNFVKDYFKFVDVDILSRLAKVVYEVAIYRNRLLASKWTLRLIVVFGDLELIKLITNDVKEWYVSKQNLDYCKYFFDILIKVNRAEFIDIIKEFQKLNLDVKQKKIIDKEIKFFSTKNKEDLEGVKDRLVEDYNFNKDGSLVVEVGNKQIRLQINPDCKITYYNHIKNVPARIKAGEKFNGVDFKDYIKEIEKYLKEQRKRLYQSFLEFRNYSLESFKEYILSNNLLNFLSQHLFWGRYKQDKLIEICLLKDDKLTHIAGNLVVDSFENYSIALVQAIDCQDVKNAIRDKIIPLFDQLDFPFFNEQDTRQNLNYIDIFNGVLVNAQLFITRLQKLKYKINDLDYNNFFTTLVKENQNLNLITVVEFDRVNLKNLNTTITISKIRFYEQKKQVKNGKVYNLSKSTACDLREINQKILSNELALIWLCSKR